MRYGVSSCRKEGGDLMISYRLVRPIETHAGLERRRPQEHELVAGRKPPLAPELGAKISAELSCGGVV